MSKTHRKPAPAKRATSTHTDNPARVDKRREMAERMRRPRNAKEAARLLGD
jgi:hypothetical protein